MIKILLRHYIFEICVDVFFQQIFNNFLKPQLIDGIRKLRTNYTLEAARDMKIFYGSDLESELIKSISDELDEILLRSSRASIRGTVYNN